MPHHALPKSFYPMYGFRELRRRCNCGSGSGRQPRSILKKNNALCPDPHTCLQKVLTSFPSTHASSHPKKGLIQSV